MSTELTIDGVNYRTGQLNAKQQFHVARRLAPLVTKMADAAVKQGETTELSPLFAAIAMAVRELSDEDCDYVIRTCMLTVMREQSGHWVSVWNRVADQPQFSDLSMAAMMQLTIGVLQDNLGSFMPAQLGPGNPAATTRPNVH